MSAWSRFCRADGVVADPFTVPEAFVRDVAALVSRWNIEVVMPGHEDAIPLREFAHLLPASTRLACPELEPLRLGVDKVELARIATAAGVLMPRTAFPRSVAEAMSSAPTVGFPLVVKLRRSNSAKGVRIARSLDQLHVILMGNFVANCADPEDFPFLQTFHEGTVVGGCFMARQGRIVASFGERYLRTKGNGMGTSVFRECYDSKPLLEQVAVLAAALHWDGIGHFDFIEDPQTRALVLLEMNPRPWGAINLALVNGYDFPAALIAQTLGNADLDEYFPGGGNPGLRGLWLIGEGIRGMDLLVSRQFGAALRAPLEILRSFPRTRCDDFVWHDPLPLLAEALCYARGFLKAGGDTNPG